MPSLQVFPQSGGIGIVSGNPYSGTLFPVGGVQLKVDTSGGPIYVGLAIPLGVTPPVSGGPMTFTSGGSLTSGGLLDGVQLAPGDPYFIPKVRLSSGLQTIRLNCAAASSGTRLYWECF